MRSHFAGLLGLGLVLSLTIVAPPAVAGCSSLVAQPTGCATAIYYNAKENAADIAANAGGYASAMPGFAAACGQVPEVGVGLPGLPAAPALPGSEPASAWAGAVQGHAAAFRDAAGVNNLGPAAATLFASGYGSTMALALYYNDASDSIILALIPETLPSSPGQLPSPPAPGPPEVPDATAGVDVAMAWAGASAGSAAQGAGGMVACFQALPMP